MPQVQSNGGRWFPTTEQLKDPAALERSFRQLLTQHYALQDRFDALSNAMPSAAATPETNGPANTKLLGLNVEPVDTGTLANGATLKFNKARGTFSFQ